MVTSQFGLTLTVEFQFEFGDRDGDHLAAFMRYIYVRYVYVRLRCTSKAGVRLLVSPRREEQTDVYVLASHNLRSEGVPGLRDWVYSGV